MSTFGWCLDGHHDLCRRKLQRLTIDDKRNTVIWLDEWDECQCSKRGCECFVPARERNKTNRKRKK